MLAHGGAASSPTAAAPGPAGAPPVYRHQSEQSGTEGGREDQAVAERLTDLVVSECLVDRRPGVGEHVPEQKHQDAGGHRVERRLELRQGRAQAADGQPEIDGESGDRAEDGDLGRRHDPRSYEMGINEGSLTQVSLT